MFTDALPGLLYNPLIIGAGVVALVVALLRAAIDKPLRKQDHGFMPVALLNGTERAFFRELESAVPELRVFPQVAMGALLQPRQRGYAAWNQIAGQRVDFVVALRDDPCAVVAVIELDGRSHDRGPRRAADAARDTRLAAGGYEVIRWRCERGKGRPDAAAMRERLMDPALLVGAEKRRQAAG
jgi:hypothetical protein